MLHRADTSILPGQHRRVSGKALLALCMLIIFQARDSARNGDAVEGLKLNPAVWRSWTENDARVATTEQTSAIEDYVVAKSTLGTSRLAQLYGCLLYTSDAADD